MKILMLLTALILSSATFAQTIKVGKLAKAPTLDGSGSDWGSVSATVIKLVNTKKGGKSKVASVSMKAGVSGGDIYFLAEWSDSSHGEHHKPYVWNAGAKKYEAGKQREDRLALNFAMSGDFTHKWDSGKTFKADMWHWKSYRTNASGIAHDKMTIISSTPSKKSYKMSAGGKTVYIQRPSDSGDKLYKTKRYSSKEKDIMPKYILNMAPTGSIADVKAKAKWANGKWTVEFKRKLNTGNADDAVFKVGSPIKGTIGVFDASGDDDHNISETITYQL